MKQGILLLTLSTILWANATVYEELWRRLELRTDATVNYFRESERSYKIRKQILKTGESISTSPFVQGSGGSDSQSDITFGFGNQASWSHPKFDSYVSFTTREDHLESANLQFLYTLKSDKSTRIACMDSLIAMTKKKAELQREAMLFNDFQQLVNYKVQYDYLLAEITARTKMNKRTMQFLKKLKQFVSAGVVPRNATQSISLFLDNNVIRIDALQLESELLLDNVAYLFDISRELFLGLDMDTLLQILATNEKKQFEKYNWRLDSLNTEIQRMQMYEQDLNSWKLSAGASVNFFDNESFSTVDNKLHLKFDYTFHKKEFAGYPRLRRIEREELTKGSDIKLEEYKELAMAHAKKATKWIDNTLERIQLGQVGVIYEISQNLDIILNQQIQYYVLRSSYYRRELSQLQSMQQLPEELRWKR